jgi:hypothetical protein
MLNRSLFASVLAIALLPSQLDAQLGSKTGTTVLTFGITGGGNGTVISQTYGDNVTGPASGSFTYGGSGGFTPNVTVAYSGNLAFQQLDLWTTGYNDLTNVAFYDPDSSTGFQITLTAAPGYWVELDGFDLGRFGTAVNLAGVTVTGATAGVLAQLTSVPLNATAGPHVSIDFSPAVADSQITISIDTTGLGATSDDVGIDNVQFSEYACGIGQGNTTSNALRVNDIGATGCRGPYPIALASGGSLTFTWNGPANMPFLLVVGPQNPANLFDPCTGTVDIGTPFGYTDVIVMFDGMISPLFSLNGAGFSEQSFTVPVPPGTPLGNFQGVIFQPAGSPCPIKLTAAFYVST